MNFTKAFAVFMQIDSKEFTEDEKYEAIQQVLDAATINSITKKQVLNVVSWLFNKQQKYRWHDLRDKRKEVYMAKKFYSWAKEKYSNNYSEAFETIEECIKEAKNMGCEVDTVIWIGRVEEVDIRRVCLTSILEDLHNAVCDDVGEVAEDWYIEDIDNKEAYEKCENAINDLVVKYIEENGMEPTFANVVDSEPYAIK